MHLSESTQRSASGRLQLKPAEVSLVPLVGVFPKSYEKGRSFLRAAIKRIQLI
jgi:hypothetical protein